MCDIGPPDPGGCHGTHAHEGRDVHGRGPPGRGEGLRHAARGPLRRGGGSAAPDRLFRGPYRRLPLPWRGQPRLRRAARRGRRQSCGADDAQCRLGRPHPSRAFSRRHGARLGGNPADAGPRGSRLPAELHLRALPDAVPAEAGRPDRLGRIQCHRLRQFGHRRAHQPLWRFHRPCLRHHRPGAGLRPASDGKPPRPHRHRRVGHPCGVGRGGAGGHLPSAMRQATPAAT